jgi:hypothetical protein
MFCQQMCTYVALVSQLLPDYYSCITVVQFQVMYWMEIAILVINSKELQYMIKFNLDHFSLAFFLLTSVMRFIAYFLLLLLLLLGMNRVLDLCNKYVNVPVLSFVCFNVTYLVANECFLVLEVQFRCTVVKSPLYI